MIKRGFILIKRKKRQQKLTTHWACMQVKKHPCREENALILHCVFNPFKHSILFFALQPKKEGENWHALFFAENFYYECTLQLKSLTYLHTMLIIYCQSFLISSFSFSSKSLVSSFFIVLVRPTIKPNFRQFSIYYLFLSLHDCYCWLSDDDNDYDNV